MHEEELILNKFPATPMLTQCAIRMVKRGKIRKLKVDVRKKIDNEVEDGEGNGLKGKGEKVNDVKNKCNKCDEEFEDGSELKNHLKIVHREWCEMPGCGKEYIDVRMLRMHKRKVHGEVIFCGGCDVDFSCEDELDEHKERYHASEKKYKKGMVCVHRM